MHYLEIMTALIIVIGAGCSYQVDKTDRNGAEKAEAVLPTFESLKENIFDRRCTQCHSAAGSARHIPLDTIDALVTSPRELVIPGNADDSGLVLAVERADKKRMPPPDVDSALAVEEVAAIRLWIQNGARD
ncbi:MAG: hypothetical protein EOP06_07225 [Proteobacteria bacterium]|nr:MAG: hypothetical protein EOP06_07225 [Pseudomonadota bacterium]